MVEIEIIQSFCQYCKEKLLLAEEQEAGYHFNCKIELLQYNESLPFSLTNFKIAFIGSEPSYKLCYMSFFGYAHKLSEVSFFRPHKQMYIVFNKESRQLYFLCGKRCFKNFKKRSTANILQITSDFNIMSDFEGMIEDWQIVMNRTNERLYYARVWSKRALVRYGDLINYFWNRRV